MIPHPLLAWSHLSLTYWTTLGWVVKPFLTALTLPLGSGNHVPYLFVWPPHGLYLPSFQVRIYLFSWGILGAISPLKGPIPGADFTLNGGVQGAILSL